MSKEKDLKKLQKEVEEEILAFKEILTNTAEEYGVYEDFGQREVMKLVDKYRDLQYGSPEERAIWRLIEDFDKWCMNFS